MAKVITSNHELIEWCESILLNEKFLSKVGCPKVSFYFTLRAFEIQGDLSANYFDLDDLPLVIRQADSLSFYAKDNMLMFKAHYQAD